MGIDDKQIDLTLSEKDTWIHNRTAVRQSEDLYDDIPTENLVYWRQQLAELPKGLLLPTDRPRSAKPNSRVATYHALLHKTLTENLKQLSSQEGVMLYITLVAAFQTLLSRYSGQD